MNLAKDLSSLRWGVDGVPAQIYMCTDPCEEDGRAPAALEYMRSFDKALALVKNAVRQSRAYKSEWNVHSPQKR